MSDYASILVAGFAALGFGLNLYIQIRSGAWDAAKRESKLKEFLKDSMDKLRSETAQNLAEINKDIDGARRDANEAYGDAVGKFGDTVLAIRQKINDDALHSERTFLRRDDFRGQFDSLDRKIDAGFDRIDRRLDDIQQKN